MLPHLGWGELVVIFFIVLLLFGAKRLPEIGRSIGQGIKSFKKGLHEAGNDTDGGKDGKE